ncbi:MAG TPA: beta-Ig-H3/fasciclin, partial [Mesotoga sp.]|nr:beta-Ig-H3/fasciclin [Mesotoga sp.]
MVRNLLLVLIVISSLGAFGQNDILSMLRETEELSYLSRKVESSGLDVLLSGPGPFTLFAP